MSVMSGLGIASNAAGRPRVPRLGRSNIVREGGVAHAFSVSLVG